MVEEKPRKNLNQEIDPTGNRTWARYGIRPIECFTISRFLILDYKNQTNGRNLMKFSMGIP